jgi:membrane dipeptidase
MSTEASSDTVERIHADSLIIEGHRDCYEQIHRLNEGDDNPIKERMVPRLKQGGVDALLYAIGGDTIAHSNGRDKRLLATLENLQAFNRAMADPDTGATTVLTADDLPTAPDGRVHFILHLEGGGPLDGSMAALEAFFALGVRSMQPTWNVRNELGDGVLERDTNGGLTRFGVAVVREMERLGMVLDLSHMSEAGFWHSMRCTTAPLVVTHANARAVLDHPRNITDAQIQAVAERGGVIGAHTLPTYVDEAQPDVERMVDHIAHMAELVGVEHVGVGADFIKSDGPRSGREALFHNPHKVPQLIDMGEIDELPNLTAALLRRGFTDADVRAILGGNFARVLRELLP